MRLRRDALLGAVLAILACGLFAFLPAEMSPDGWYALLGGDIVFHQGLPHHDSLTVWGSGREWVDQQWLAQLAYYGLYSLGGLRLALLVNAGIVMATFAVAAALARLRGGAPRDVLYVAVPAAITIGQQSSALRPQTLALPLFVALTWLLIEDARTPSRQVLWTIPLLLLWGNLHGSVTLGVGLVLLSALLGLWKRTHPLRHLTLGLLAIATLYATPYAASVTGYYRTILFNADFAKYLPDWMPTSLSPGTLAFYVLAVGTVVAVGRMPSVITLFERLALVALLVLAIEARRGIVWFTLLALIAIPPACAAFRLPPIGVLPGRLARGVVIGVLVALTVSLGIAISRPNSWFTSNYPTAAARAASDAAGASGHVFANGAYGDWLLLVEPALRGRVAYDARLEMLPPGRLADAVAVSIGRWDARRILRGYDVLVLRPQETELRDEVVSRWGWRQIRADGKVVVLSRAHAVISQALD